MSRYIYSLLLVFVSFLLPAGQTYAQINTERVMNIGRNALYFDDYVLSIQYFNQVIKVKPYMAEPYFYRAVAKLNLEDFKGAEEDCTLCIERNPFLTDAYQVRGIARQSLGDYQGAVDDYTRGLQMAPEDRTNLNNKALALAQMERYDEAESSFAELIRLHPNYWNGYMSRSQVYLEKGDTIRALKDLDRAIELDKHIASAYAQRSIILAQQARYKEALADINEAVRLEPKDVSFYLNRALMKYHLDDLRGAMSDYDYILEMDPENAMTHYNRGLLRIQVGDYNRAIRDFSAVIQAEPENYFAYYNRAVLYSQTGNHRQAIRDYDVVLKQYPDFVEGLFARSKSKLEIGDKKSGEKDFDLALELQKKQAEENKRQSAVAGKNDATASSDTAQKERKASDKNINKFDKLLVADTQTDFTPKQETGARGRVQNSKVQISIEPEYVLTYYERPDMVRQHIYYVRELDELNRLNVFRYRLQLTNREAALNTDQINMHFASVNDFSRLIEINPQNPLAYFGRAIDFMLIQDFGSAIEDLNQTIYLSRNFMLAYFARAVVRFKQIQYTLSAGNMGHIYGSDPKGKNTDKPVADATALDYEMVLRDYDKVLEFAPDFVYAYFNRANVRCARQDYYGAVSYTHLRAHET